MTIATDDFWHFSLKAYEITQVKDTLLYAQDNLGLNVNLGLFCLYLNQQNIFLTKQQMQELVAKLDEFSSTFTKELRALRFDFRTKQQELSHYEQIKKALLKAELLLEQQEQELLVNTTNKWQIFKCENQNNLALYQSLLPIQTSGHNNLTLQISDLNQYIH